MARQVVSYDDLDGPSGVSMQIPNTDSISGASKERTDPASPPGRKRLRDEVNPITNGAVSRDFENNMSDTREGLGTTPGIGHSSSLPLLPPRPQVKKRGRKRRRVAGARGNGMTEGGFQASNNGAVSLSVQHWDDPGMQADGISYDEVGGESLGIESNQDHVDYDEGEYGEMNIEENEDYADDDQVDDESRELTHEEVWDDSALIAAWDAATEEYEAIHGKTKRWKKERAYKSPLWYNVPPEKPAASSNKGKGKPKTNVDGVSSAANGHAYGASGAKDDETQSSAPLNFETFVPTHDASLTFPNPTSPPSVPGVTLAHLQDITSQYSTMLPASPFAYQHGSGSASSPPSADEAFSRGLGAMYWCGYWTAVYHIQRAHEQRTAATVDEREVEGGLEAQEDEVEMLVSTQR